MKKKKKKTGCLNKEYNALFENTDMNIRAYPRCKKSALINDYVILCYYILLLLIQQSPSKARCRQTSPFLPNTSEGSEGQCHLNKIWLFLLSFKLGNKIPSTQTDKKHVLFLKAGDLILNWIPLYFFYNHPMSHRVSSQTILPNSFVN